MEKCSFKNCENLRYTKYDKYCKKHIDHWKVNKVKILSKSDRKKYQSGRDKRIKKRKNWEKRQYLEKTAEKFRRKPTYSELIFKEKLESLYEVKFNFQEIIRYKGLDFIYDFHILSPRKVFIEIDGGYHETDEQRQTDRIKNFICTNILNQPIIRLTNEQAGIIEDFELWELIL